MKPWLLLLLFAACAPRVVERVDVPISQAQGLRFNVTVEIRKAGFRWGYMPNGDEIAGMIKRRWPELQWDEIHIMDFHSETIGPKEAKP